MICTPHRGSSCVRISHVNHACSERFSSTLSSPFDPTSSSHHSSSISCTSSCTSSTTLRALVTLRTSPKRRWTLLTNPTSPQKTRRSGGCLRVGQHTLATWSSTQKVVSLSSAESEYYSMVHCASEAIGLANTIRELGHEAQVRIWTDAAAARGLAL